MRFLSAGRGPAATLRLLAATLILVSPVAGCTATVASDEPGGGPGNGVVLIVLGDSITAGTEALRGAELVGEGSWVPAAVGFPIVLGGGWAVPGATTADMRSGVGPVDGDVAVLMAGTNDISRGVDWRESRDNLLAVARTLRVPRVLLAAIPPYSANPAAALAFNEGLRELALEQEWSYTDPWVREGTGGSWADGASTDGVHPVQAAADEAGERLRDAVLDVVSG